MSLVTSFLRLIIFKATSFPLTLCMASLTLPKEPSPSVLMILYWPKRWLVRFASSVLCRCCWLGLGFSAWSLGLLESRRELVVDMERESSSSSRVEVIIPAYVWEGLRFERLRDMEGCGKQEVIVSLGVELEVMRRLISQRPAECRSDSRHRKRTYEVKWSKQSRLKIAWTIW